MIAVRPAPTCLEKNLIKKKRRDQSNFKTEL